MNIALTDEHLLFHYMFSKDWLWFSISSHNSWVDFLFIIKLKSAKLLFNTARLAYENDVTFSESITSDL